MSGKGNSKAKTTSTSSTSTVNNIDNRVYATDQGAVEKAFDFAEGNTEAILTTVLEAFDFADARSSEALGFASDASGQALDFADAASERQSESFRDAFEFGRETQAGAAEFVSNLFTASLDAVTGVVSEGQLQLGNTVSNLNAIARQQSTSTDERVAGIAQYAILGVGAVVAIIAVALIFRR